VDDGGSFSDDEDFFSIVNDVDVDADVDNGFVRISSPSTGFGMGNVVANLLEETAIMACCCSGEAAAVVATGEFVGDGELPHSLPHPLSLLLLYPKSVIVEEELERERLEGGPEEEEDFVVWVAFAS